MVMVRKFLILRSAKSISDRLLDAACPAAPDPVAQGLAAAPAPVL